MDQVEQRKNFFAWGKSLQKAPCHRPIITRQPNPFTTESANGKFQLFIPTVSFSVGYHF